MNLQRLDKQQTLRKIDLKNTYRAYLWKKNRSRIKYIELLSNNIQESGIKFIQIWENLDFFLAVNDKYDDINDAKNFIDECIAQFDSKNEILENHKLYKNSETKKIIEKATKGDEIASTIVECRFIIYASAYDLLYTIVAKVLSGYTFEVAYYEATNNIFSDEIVDLESIHSLFAEYFKFENEEEYTFKPYKLYTTNEYILSSDISQLIDIVCEITNANILLYDLIVPSREGKIFEEPELGIGMPAKLYEYETEPYIEYGSLKMEVSPNDLGKDIFVGSIYLDLDDGKIKTISNENEVTAEDVAQTLRYLLGKPIYIHPIAKNFSGNQIEISWVEAV